MFFFNGGGLTDKRTSAGIGGVKGKQKNVDKGEGVKNPSNFADVLYEWSLKLYCHLPIGRCGGGGIGTGRRRGAGRRRVSTSSAPTSK